MLLYHSVGCSMYCLFLFRPLPRENFVLLTWMESYSNRLSTTSECGNSAQGMILAKKVWDLSEDLGILSKKVVLQMRRFPWRDWGELTYKDRPLVERGVSHWRQWNHTGQYGGVSYKMASHWRERTESHSKRWNITEEYKIYHGRQRDSVEFYVWKADLYWKFINIPYFTICF